MLDRKHPKVGRSFKITNVDGNTSATRVGEVLVCTGYDNLADWAIEAMEDFNGVELPALLMEKEVQWV